MLFFAQSAQSRVTQALIFCKGTVQKTNKQNGLGNYFRRNEKIRFLNLRQDLEYNLFNNDSKCGDCEYDSAYVNYRSEGVFDKSSDEAECWRCRAVNIPFDGTAQTPRFRSPLYPDYGSRLYCLEGWGVGEVPREGLASLLGRGSNGVKVLYTLLRDCGVFIFNLLYYSKNAAPPRAGGLAL